MLMKAFLARPNDATIVIMARAVGPRLLGDAIWEVRRGDNFLGHSYDDLSALGIGPCFIEPKGRIASATSKKAVNN